MKSECSEYQEKIASFLLGDVTEGDKQALEAHLAACAQCRSERESYARTLRQLASAGDVSIPHHFFLHPEERSSNPWQLFRRMRLGWQAAVASAALLILLLGIATISRLQIRSNPDGWAISFGGSAIDSATLKKDILEAAEQKSREAKAAWIQEMRSEIARSQANLSREQQLQLTAVLARMDARTLRRIVRSEQYVKVDTQKLVSDVYQIMAQQRAQDLEAINLRFDATDAHNAVKAQQQNEILGNLLQIADLKFQ